MKTQKNKNMKKEKNKTNMKTQLEELKKEIENLTEWCSTLNNEWINLKCKLESERKHLIFIQRNEFLIKYKLSEKENRKFVLSNILLIDLHGGLIGEMKEENNKFLSISFIKGNYDYKLFIKLERGVENLTLHRYDIKDDITHHINYVKDYQSFGKFLKEIF